MNARLPLALAQALMPMAPPSSAVHRALVVSPGSSWDYPATDKELDACHGVTLSEADVDFAIEKASAKIDDGELGDVCACVYDDIRKAAATGDPAKVGRVVLQAVRQRIADLASRDLFGKPGLISADRVQA